jgi:GTPase
MSDPKTNSSSTPVVAIVGRANAGKSSLFNRLIGIRQAITHDTPGTTRDPNYGLVSWGSFNFWLVDTAGFKSPDDDFEAKIREQVDQAATSADVIVVVVDGGTMMTPEDLDAARASLKTGKPVILAVNKIDTARTGHADDFRRLGVKTIVDTSAVHGTGSGDLLDAITAHIAKTPPVERDNVVRIAILGRPNVGKSSILNALAGKQQAIVADRAGTTRDASTTTLRYKGRQLDLIDTAGLRRRGKIERGIEEYSAMRTLGAINSADISLLLIDATELAVAGDQHIAGSVLEAGKGLIIVVNKWDLVDKDDKTQARYIRRIQTEFEFAPWAPLIFTSATQGLNVTKIFELATEIYDRRNVQIPTPKLNIVLKSLTTKHPPAGLKNRQPKMNYMVQTGTQPPTFTIFSTYAEFVHFSYRRYIENGLRAEYDFIGTPIRLDFRSKNRGE